MKGNLSLWKPGLYLAVALLACGPALGQYSANFEAPTFSGSAAGTIMTGQDGYYIPAGTVSTDYMVYSYAGNAIGAAVNPDGGSQFVAGIGPGGGTYARAQRDYAWGSGVTEVLYDVNAIWLPDPNFTVTNNLGSFSHQPTTAANGVQIHLFSWEEGFEGERWQALYLHYDEFGVQVAQPGSAPGPEWENLELNHWYRMSTIVDFDTNQIIRASITDLTTGTTTTAETTGYYLSGGATGGPLDITAFRFFAGGGGTGNVIAWDNFSIAPPGAPCPGDLDGDNAVGLGDLAILLSNFGTVGGMDPSDGDLDNDDDVDLGDLALLLALFGTLC